MDYFRTLKGRLIAELDLDARRPKREVFFRTWRRGVTIYSGVMAVATLVMYLLGRVRPELAVILLIVHVITGFLVMAPALGALRLWQVEQHRRKLAKPES
jgi:hypothetical protein